MDDYLREIRQIDGFANAKVTGITVEKSRKRVTVYIITDKTYTDEDKQRLTFCLSRHIPAIFTFDTDIKKIVADCDMVKRKVFEIAKGLDVFVNSTLSEDDIVVTEDEDGFSFTISLTGIQPPENFIESILKQLDLFFCGNFKGRCTDSGKDITELMEPQKEENVEYVVAPRRFNIEGFKRLESANSLDTAIYMADFTFLSDREVVCGKITAIETRERKDKKDPSIIKPFFIFTITDTTASIRFTCFPRQAHIKELSKLEVGDEIVATLKCESYNGGISFTSLNIDYGHIPEGFVPAKRASKPCPKYYETVNPEKYHDVSQTDMFTVLSVPSFFMGHDFVVVDIETTGRNTAGANIDKIIEIGACKIRDGEIIETFSSLINPGMPLPKEIVELTGITDEMLTGQPVYEDVMPDFFKFCEGADLVGHNIEGFDYKFLSYYLGQLGYIFDCKVYDTLPLGRLVVKGLKNYKLNTLGDHYGFEFNHHRACDDCVVTGKIFIELVKDKKSDPDPCF